ncbi:predicted protein [Botrytis cinerea T4]|uniref:Uncharacterized protein n=1 Tax=Botryotinia fuckeliana (strain T4) TaxID=999810 RepID=G2YEK7_BOTF4|nr:predicted protein [Botrytis cinerea T4]
MYHNQHQHINANLSKPKCIKLRALERRDGSTGLVQVSKKTVSMIIKLDIVTRKSLPAATLLL